MKRVFITAAALLLLFSVQSAEARDISVLIKQNAQQCTVSGTSYYITAPGAAASERSGQLTLSANGSMLAGANTPYSLPAEITSKNPITVNGRTYRGRILLDGSSGSFNIVNIVDINDYIKGVLADEMSPAWPAEALKAQAVLARTYVLEGKRHGKYDACAAIHCQSYSGVKGESPAVDAAVDSTAGEILKYGGMPARVHYFADSGGCTASAMSVWHKDVPYLRAKPDPVPASGPRSRWQATFTMSKISSSLAAAGLYSGSVNSLRPAERDESGRVKKIEITGSAGSRVIEAAKFRLALGADLVKSTLFEFSATGGTSQGYNTASQPVYSSLPPAPQNNRPVIVDVSTMPEKDEDILYWMAQNKIFTLQELVSMIGKNKEYPKYVAEGKRRIAAGKGAQQKPVQPQPAVQQNLPPAGARLSDSAASGSSVTIYGRGLGHGVGMPQWTAKALAESGWDYRRILDYYFTGTTLEKVGS